MSLTDLKEQVKELPISSIISRYIALQKKGTLLTGICPFHNDTKPSLTVNDRKNMFMCFACNTGGDAIYFVKKYKNYDFKDALVEIAKSAGISYEEHLIQKKRSPKEEMARKILSRATEIYGKIAEKGSVPSFNKFKTDRGLTDKHCSEFDIGFAPKTNELSKYLQTIPNGCDREFALKTAVEIGVIRFGEKHQNYYDAFRDRIMFQIRNQFGTVVGMGGRAVTKDQSDNYGKYINSQESFVFSKKHILYGHHLAKPHIRDKNFVIIAEGYMDLIGLHKHGFSNSVAVMGTAAGENAVSGLKTLTRNFYLGLDSDGPGFNAMKRLNEFCLKEGIIPKYLDFSPHKDPDEFLENLGGLELQKKIDEAKPFVDVLIEQVIPEKAPEVFDRKLELLDIVFEIIYPLGKELAATERVIKVAKDLKLQSDPAQIITAYKRFLSNKVLNSPKTRQVEKEQAPLFQEEKNLREPVTSIIEKEVTTLDRADRYFIKEIVAHPELLTHGKFNELIDFVGNTEVKRYVAEVRNMVYEIDDSEYASFISDIMNGDDYSTILKDCVAEGLFIYQKSELNEKVLGQLIFDIKKRLEKERLEERRSNLKQARKSSHEKVEEDRIMQEIIELEKEISALKMKKYKK